MDYQDVILDMGLDIVQLFVPVAANDAWLSAYGGDLVAVVTRPGKVGLLVFGFGTCPVCDALQAALSNDPDYGPPHTLDELKAMLEQATCWADTPAELLAAAEARDWEGTHFYHDPVTRLQLVSAFDVIANMERIR